MRRRMGNCVGCADSRGMLMLKHKTYKRVFICFSNSYLVNIVFNKITNIIYIVFLIIILLFIYLLDNIFMYLDTNEEIIIDSNL